MTNREAEMDVVRRKVKMADKWAGRDVQTEEIIKAERTAKTMSPKVLNAFNILKGICSDYDNGMYDGEEVHLIITNNCKNPDTAGAQYVSKHNYDKLEGTQMTFSDLWMMVRDAVPSFMGAVATIKCLISDSDLIYLTDRYPSPAGVNFLGFWPHWWGGVNIKANGVVDHPTWTGHWKVLPNGRVFVSIYGLTGAGPFSWEWDFDDKIKKWVGYDSTKVDPSD